MNKKFRLATKG